MTTDEQIAALEQIARRAYKYTRNPQLVSQDGAGRTYRYFCVECDENGLYLDRVNEMRERKIGREDLGWVEVTAPNRREADQLVRKVGDRYGWHWTYMKNSVVMGGEGWVCDGCAARLADTLDEQRREVARENLRRGRY